MERLKRYINRILPYLLLIGGLLYLAYNLSRAVWTMSAAVIGIPFLILLALIILKKPYWGFITVFITNYFLIAGLRYSYTSGLSVIVDSLVVFTIICLLFNKIAGKKYPWHRANNKLMYLSLLWGIYVALQIFNPSAMFEPWFYNRGAIYAFPAIVFLTSVLLDKYKDIRNMLFLLSILTLIAIGKALWQKFIGFDAAEWKYLNDVGGSTHLLVSGTRYFSIFTDAGNFGSNMGFAMVVFMIMSFYVKGNALRVYYFAIALLAGYCLTISGTRGAMIVPLGGTVMYILLNKNIRQMVTAGILLVFIYIFFAYTYLLESNPQIRRMRTAFRPTNDASFNVRLENQKKLAQYMKHKPFGEGLGLAGVENRRFSYRFTTMIPTDSHFVNIWVQFGIVGLCIHLAILLFILIYSGYLILFRIKDRELRGTLMAINCGLFGIMLSAYGNNFFTQYPTGYIVYMCQTFLILGESYDKEIAENNELKQLQTTVVS